MDLDGARVARAAAAGDVVGDGLGTTQRTAHRARQSGVARALLSTILVTDLLSRFTPPIEMQKPLIALLLAASGLVGCEHAEQRSSAAINLDELIFVVAMNVNEGKSLEDVAAFARPYPAAVERGEPGSLGWGFFEAGEKVMLIERYRNGEAMMEHGKNISEGGPLESEFGEFMEFFTIEQIDVYGNASEEVREFVKPFGLPFVFHPVYSSFSRD